MKWSEKTVFLTGGNGFVGSRVANRLAETGARVRALVRRPGETPELRSGSIEEIAGEFTDPQATRAAMKGCDLVVHCAATVGKDLEDARRINRDGTAVVLDAAMELGVDRVVHISTVAVYDIGDRAVVDETTPLATEGHPYSVSKAEAETVLWDRAEKGLSAVALRPCAILGIHPTSTWGYKIPERVREGKLPLVIDGKNTWAYVHVENLVDACLAALELPAAVGKAYNVVDGHTTWLDYTDEIRSWFGTPELPRVSEEESPSSYWTGTYSTDRITEDLGYRPRLRYEDGMAEAERFWRERAAAETKR